MSYVAQIKEGEGPLVLALHGTGGDEHQFFGLAGDLVPGATIVSPRGDVSEMGAARFFKRTGEGVYDMEDLARAVDKMGNFVEGFAHAGPVYAFGYSNGANILAATLLRYPGLFDRVGLLHPLIPWTPEPVDMSGKDVLITAGQRDPITPWAESQKLLTYFEGQGARVSKVVHEGGHELRREELIALQSLMSTPVTV
ncbi:MAG: alpha/beta hydrolase [Pseudomonadota bacterium]